MKFIPTEYLIGSFLLKERFVDFDKLFDFERSMVKEANDFILDMSKNSIISTIEEWSDYFKLENESLTLTDFYADNIDRIKYRFYDNLEASLRDAIDNYLSK